MKVALITRHAVFNYGSLLQTIATQQCLEKLGHSCQVIDYCRQDEDYRKIASVLLTKNPKWNQNILTRGVYRLLQSPKFWIMGRHFEKMRKHTISTTRKYTSCRELEENKPDADCYMTGSDQVWGPIGSDAFDPAYFLSFAQASDWKVAYAASFGKTEFTAEQLSCFAEYLKQYQAIGVREKSALELLNGMGLTNVQQVLDPTLLLPVEVWDQWTDDVSCENYILIYQLHSNARMMDYAYALSRKTGLPLVSMSSTAQHLARKGSKHVFLPTLGHWLGYIRNAAFMITDSFHGTAFAINFNTQFVNILPQGTATRNQSILELTGLTDRVVTDYNDFRFFEEKINFAQVNQRIAEKQKESFDFLQVALQKGKGVAHENGM